MHSNTHLVEEAKYLLEHGISIDVIGFQIHLLGSLVDPLNPMDVYHLMNNLEGSLPDDMKFYAKVILRSFYILFSSAPARWLHTLSEEGFS